VTNEHLRASIRERIGRGDALESLESELIETAPVSEEERSALWLYAWHCIAHPRPAHTSWADRLLPDRLPAVERSWAAG
jgi:hypothetical protein